MRKAVSATILMIVQAPIVPPTIGPRLCFFSPPLPAPGEDDEEVGVVAGLGVSVTVTTFTLVEAP